MGRRPLGQSGITVFPLAFGGNVFGWTVREDREAFPILNAFVEAGGNLIDTADSYSRWVPGNQGGESEALIGRWLRTRKDRGNLVIATKVGADLGSGRKGLSRAHILASAEASLKRLSTDYIDLYQSHFDDPSVPVQETLEAYQELIRDGKVRVIGASNFGALRIREAGEVSRTLGFPRYESLQPRYNLYDREDFEKNLAAVCHQQGMGVIPYYSLASGFLSGKYRSEKDLSQGARGKGAASYLNERGYRILRALDDVASSCQVSPSSIAIAWLVSREDVTAAIASATGKDQLSELVLGATLKLDRSSLDILDHASSWSGEGS
ncbi:MAG TPA: aldo/keto reductase [Chitinophagaceae bacterium]|nr:aldo/keto reductase [Chitinophagaceae bacterium]